MSLSELRDAYLDDDSKYKRTHGLRLLNKRDYVDIYASYRVFRIAELLGVSAYSVVSRILEYYFGSSVDNGDNYQLQLLHMQYSSFELCDTEDEVKFLYSFFSAPSSASALRSVGFDDVTISPSVYRHFDDVVSSNLLTPIKHKDRNSYFQYKLHH